MWLPWRGPAPCRTTSDPRTGPPSPLRRLIAVAWSLSSGSGGRDWYALPPLKAGLRAAASGRYATAEPTHSQRQQTA